MECVFCDEECTQRFRNKGLCQDCAEKIKLLFKRSVSKIEQQAEEKQEEIVKTLVGKISKKTNKPVIIEMKRVRQ